MYILGISSGLKHGHDGAAVLIKEGKVIFAAEEERFTLSNTQDQNFQQMQLNIF